MVYVMKVEGEEGNGIEQAARNHLTRVTSMIDQFSCLKLLHKYCWTHIQVVPEKACVISEVPAISGSVRSSQTHSLQLARVQHRNNL